MRASLLLPFVFALTIAPQIAALADESIVVVRPSRRDATSEAIVDVRATPATVYAAVTDYSRWPGLFRDVARVKVENPDRERGEVRFESRALGHEVTIRFDNRYQRVVRFRLVDGPPGARATGEYVLEDLGDGRTRVRASLYMDVVGAAGWLVTDGQIRRRRERKLRSDLADLVARFAPRPVAERRP